MLKPKINLPNYLMQLDTMSENSQKMLRWAHLPECQTPPKDWKVAYFKEIANVIAGQSPSSETYNEKGIGLPFLQGNADFGHKNPIPKAWCSASKKIAEKNDILLSVRAPVGEINRAEQNYAIGRGLASLRGTEVDQDFLHQAIQRWRWCLQRVSQGTTFDAVTARHFKQLHVLIPPPEEQKAIARILDAVDMAIERTYEAINISFKFEYSLLHEILEGNSGNNQYKIFDPKLWPVYKVGEVADVGSGVTLGKDVSGFKSVELPYLRVANVQDGYLDLSTIKTVRVRMNEVDNFRLEPGDVLMTEGGDIDKLGRGAIWDGQITDCLHQNHIFRVRANRNILEPYFFAFIVESNIAKKYFLRVAKRTTNLASINKTQLKAFPFPVPPLIEQRKIIPLIKAAKAKTAALKQKEGALQMLKRALMHDLLTGKVRTTNINPDPITRKKS